MSPTPQPHAWRVHRAARTGIIVDARDYYRTFYALAKQARRSILLLGWQFDSDVPLLRGKDVPSGLDPESLELLPFLDGLCAARPELEVRVLAWDHSVWLTLEREVLQKLSFALRTSKNFYFENDATVSQYGAHHQKVAIIDGQYAFFGSSDICQDRWDTSEHLCTSDLRVGRGGKPCKPYHELQALVTGEAAQSLVDLFVERWADGTGERLDPASLVVPFEGDAPLPAAVTIEMPAADVGLYRQFPHRLGRAPVRELAAMLISWIEAAERLIYIETQYFTSQVIKDALVRRMQASGRPRLDIVVILPERPEALKEELAVGATQVEVLAELTAVASETGHALGFYNVATRTESGRDVFVYIHSKLMIVDDVRMTIGSANLNNRSMSLDSEINAAWVTDDPNDAVARGVRSVRARLLSEHAAIDLPDSWYDACGLVDRMDDVASSGSGHLRHHELEHEEPSILMKLGQRIASAYADPQHSPESRETPLPFDAPAPSRPP